MTITNYICITDFSYVLNYLSNSGQTYAICFVIDIEKYKIVHEKIPKGLDDEEKKSLIKSLEMLKIEMLEFAEKTANKFARFRVDFYSSIMCKFIKNIEQKIIGEPLKVRIDEENVMVYIPTKESLLVALGINFKHKTDHNLAKLFFRELDDAKFGVGSTIDVKYFPQQIPDEIVNCLSNYKSFQAGFVQFCK
jgi:hypothetical protein